MFFDALGSLPLGTAPIEVIAVVPPGGGGGPGGGGFAHEFYIQETYPERRKRKPLSDEMIAILLAANEEYFQ